MESAEQLFNEILTNGQAGIEDLIASRKSESSILEYKRSSDPAGTKLSKTDFDNLRTAIVGFSNVEGGVLVWGIQCTPDEYTGADLPTPVCPISDVHRFASWLNGKVGDTAAPPPTGVRNEPIPFENGRDGCVVTYIPELTNDVCFTNEKPGKCMVRSGSSFRQLNQKQVMELRDRKRMPRLTLLGMTVTNGGRWGGAPQLDFKWKLENIGGTATSEYYVDFSGFRKCGYACELRRRYPPNCNWVHQHSSHSDFPWEVKIPDHVHPARSISLRAMSLVLKPPIDRELKVAGTYGCDGQSPQAFEKQWPASNIERVFNLLSEVTHTLSLEQEREFQRLLNDDGV